jgi:hypothetical protein
MAAGRADNRAPGLDHRAMTTNASISQQLERQSIVPMESTIPAEMTIEQWRRRVPRQPVPCDHLHDTTTRYDPVEKQLTFLLVCPICRTEQVVETRQYEPRFQPLAA